MLAVTGKLSCQIDAGSTLSSVTPSSRFSAKPWRSLRTKSYRGEQSLDGITQRIATIDFGRLLPHLIGCATPKSNTLVNDPLDRLPLAGTQQGNREKSDYVTS
jgi:hypothetical protein